MELLIPDTVRFVPEYLDIAVEDCKANEGLKTVWMNNAGFTDGMTGMSVSCQNGAKFEYDDKAYRDYKRKSLKTKEKNNL